MKSPQCNRVSDAKASAMITVVLWALFSVAVVGVRAASIVNAQEVPQSISTSPAVVVKPKFGGQILGYAIDPSGTEGVLSEFVDLIDGNVLAATETFSQEPAKS